MRRLSLVTACALLATPLFACESKARQLAGGSASNGCSGCHGSADNAAPPASLDGGTSTTLVEVGAHQAHLHDGVMRKAIACSECHVVPSSVDQPGHMGSPPALVSFATGAGDIAGVSGASPSWNRQTATCSGVYCHGATASGGSNKTPVWTKVGQGQAACGACHDLPPGGSHPSVMGGVTFCYTCHPGTVKPDGTIDVAGALHINGQVDVGGQGCTSCHGDANRTAVAGADTNVEAAPPVTATGRSAGAHLAHVDKTGEMMTPAQCGECHSGAVPSSTANHPGGTIVVAFSGRTNTGNAGSSYNSGTLTCSSTYCHGNFTGGASANPTWTGGAMSCTSCHGSPPGTGHHGTHSGRSCGDCHPGYTKTVANASTHVNGTKQVGNQITSWNAGSCTSTCHGSSPRTW